MKIGFIGAGNMGKALLTGFIGSGKIDRSEIFAFDTNKSLLEKNAAELGFTAADSLAELIENADIAIMACKPDQVSKVISEAKELLKGKALVSIALGWDFDRYCRELGEDVRIQFVMPNTPALTGSGVLLFEEKNSLLAEEREFIMKLFKSTGLVIELPSKLMGIGGAISGCGPAFADLFIEAYADAGVKYGLPRDTAYKMVSATLLGSAKLQLETGEHPAVLKDRVCSPGGSTIKGVTALEREGLRRACQASIDEIMK